jgi:hypothetical protein
MQAESISFPISPGSRDFPAEGWMSQWEARSGSSEEIWTWRIWLQPLQQQSPVADRFPDNPEDKEADGR